MYSSFYEPKGIDAGLESAQSESAAHHIVVTSDSERNAKDAKQVLFIF